MLMVFSARVSLMDIEVLTAIFARFGLLLGKLHPLVVHFPIALLSVACLIEIIAAFSRRPVPSFTGLLSLSGGVGSGVVAILFGLINHSHQSFSGPLSGMVDRHRNLGFLTIAFATCALFFASNRFRNRLLYLMCLTTSTAVLMISSHYGGLLVHGEDYFAEVFALPEKDESKDSRMGDIRARPTAGSLSFDNLPETVPHRVSFSKEIKPLFIKHCYRCHGNGRAKGGFNLDSREALLKGGESGEVVEPGNSGNSLLIDLVAGTHLSMIMPEKGKRLSPQEVSLLRGWIDQGVSWGETSEKTETELTDKPPPFAPNEPFLSVPIPAQAKTAPLDYLLATYFAAAGRVVPHDVEDKVFLRRVMLDLHGRAPSVEELDQLAAMSRSEVVDLLLQDKEAYARTWLSFWSDLLRNDFSGTGANKNRRGQITQWLYRALLENKPFDRFVVELVDPQPESAAFINGITWGGKLEVVDLPEMQAAQNIGQAFLGINLKCASCHNSFTDQWTLEDTYGLASVYAKKPLLYHECGVPSGEYAAARFIFPELGTISQDSPEEERRRRLGELLTSKENYRFARTVVNRLWKKLLGRGIIEPVDDMSGEAWSRDILDWLSKDFVEHGYDLQHLIRRIVLSQAYRLPAVRLSAKSPSSYFSGPLIRRLTAEQVVDLLYKSLRIVPHLTADDLERVSWVSKREMKTFITSDRGSGRATVDFGVKEGDTDLWILVHPAKEKVRTAIKNGVTRKAFADLSGLIIEESSGATRPLASSDVLQTYSLEKVVTERPETDPSRRFFVSSGTVVRLAFPYAQVKRVFGNFEGVEHGKPAKVSVSLVSGLAPSASLYETRPLLLALGRPIRDQVVSERAETLSGLDALVLQTDPEFHEMLVHGAAFALQKWSTLDEAVRHVFRALLAREISEAEMDELEGDLSQYTTHLEAVQDLVWTLLFHPEVQTIQ